MELLGDVDHVESRFSSFGDGVSVGARLVHGLRQTYYRLRNHFGRTRWYYLVMRLDQNELLVEPHHLVVPSGASKMIPEPMVHLGQTVHLSCTEANTVSKWTKTRFHTTHVT